MRTLRSAVEKKAYQIAAKASGVDQRNRLIERLKDEDAHDLASKLELCGEPLRLVCTSCGNKKSVEIACKRRWCPACSFKIQCERVEKYEKAAKLMKWPLFITLTMPNTASPECIRLIRSHWSKMRRRKLVVDRIKGGISSIEITNKGQDWHPHLHVLADCEWLAIHTPPPTRKDSQDVKRQKYDHARLELSAVWGSIIKNPVAIVSALRIPAGEALKYALKYSVKGNDLIDSKNPIAELIRSISKSRMISTFGSMHGLIQEDPEDEKPVCLCGNCGEVSSYIPVDIVERFMRISYDNNHGNRK